MNKVFFFLCVLTEALFGAPQLIIEPQEVHLHQTVTISLKGAAPKSQVKVMATMEDEKGRLWKSFAAFTADEEGMLDLSKHSPREGSYEGVDPMGLFWSMQLDKGSSDATAFRHKSLEPLHVLFAAQFEDGKVLRGKVTRKVTATPVKKVAVHEEGVVGALIKPEGEGPFPALLIFGGSQGGIPPEAYVAQFASRGFAALGLAYYQAPGVSETLANIPLEYVEKAIAWLKKQKGIKSEKLVAIGTSMGGSYALLAASHFPEIKGVVVFDGAGVVFQSLDPAANGKPPQSTFSYQGKPVPYIPITVPELKPETFNTDFFLSLFLSSYFQQQKETVEAATIQVEKINGPVLLMGTMDDRLFASAFLLHHSYKRLQAYKFPHVYEFVAYKGAGHMLGLSGFPYSPTTNCCLEIKQNNMLFEVGGSPKDMTEAQRDSWEKTFAFLGKIVSQ